jgi:hypothetical protein
MFIRSGILRPGDDDEHMGIHAWETASPVYKAVSRPGPAHEQGNLSACLKNSAVKGLVTITCTPGGKPEAVDLTREGQNRAAALTASCE